MTTEGKQLHVERVGDEVLLTVADEAGTTVVALPVPEGVDELIDALRQEAAPAGLSAIADEPGSYRSRRRRSPFTLRWNR